MAQSVSEAIKTAFRTNPIKRKYKCFIDWIAKGDTPGEVTADEWDATYFSKDNVNNDETYARYKPFILSDSMRLGDNIRLLSNKYENGWLGENRSKSNGLFGSVVLTETIRPNADGDITELDNGEEFGIDNWSYVDEEVADDWDTCVEADIGFSGEDLYNLPAHSGSGIINKITVYVRIYANEGDGCNARISIKTGGSIYYGGILSTGAAWENKSYEWTINPQTELLWTWDDIDALQIGIELNGDVGSTQCTQLYVEVDYYEDIIPEIIYMIYDDITPAKYLTVIASPYNYPIDFDLYYRDEDNLNWVLCESYSGRGNYITVYQFPSETNIKGWKIEATKISLYDMPLCIVEVQVGFREDISANIIDFEVKKELEYQSEKSLPIGNISANTLNLKLNNTHQKYNPQNEDSYVYTYLKANRIIRPYIGIDIETEIVYIPQGVFYSREFVPNPNMTVDIYAVDRMFALNERDFESSELYEGYKNSELVKELIEDFGLGASEYNIDETSGVIPYAWFEPRSYAANIKRLAIAEGGYAWFDELGVFQYRKRGWESYSLEAEYNDSSMKKDSASNPLISKNMKNYIAVKSNRLYLQIEQEIYHSTETIIFKVGETKTIPCWYSKIPCKDVLPADVTKDGDITFISETQYAYATFLTYKNNGATPLTITEIIIDGKPLESTGSNMAIAKDDDLISRYGKSDFTVNNEFIQSLDSAQSHANYLLSSYKDPGAEKEFSAPSLPYLQLGDLIKASNTKLSIDELFYRIMSITIKAGKSIIDTIKTRKMDKFELLKSLTLADGQGTLTVKTIIFSEDGEDATYEEVIFEE